MNTAIAEARRGVYAALPTPLPNNLDAERSVLGAVILDNRAIVDAMLLTPEDFFLDQHRHVFTKMVAMSGNQTPIDLVSLTEELHRSGTLEAAGGAPYIASLADGMPRISNVSHYAKIVKEKSLRRHVIHAAHGIEQLAFDGDTPPESVCDFAVQSFLAFRKEPERIEASQRPTLSNDALYGLAGDIVRKLTPETESHPAAMLIETLMSFGNIIGRSAYYEVEDTKHFGNLFAVKVGISSKSRKGTASARISRIFEQIDPNWMSKHRSGLGSGEGVIWYVRDPTIEGDKIIDEGVTDQRMFVYEGEFASALAVMKRDGNTLSPVIRNAWDCKALRSTVKNSPAASTGAHISILGDITQGELILQLSQADKHNGFANRFLWIHVERCGEKPFGGEPIDFTQEIAKLKAAVESAKWRQRVFMDRNARLMWLRIYGGLSEGQPGLLGAVTSRAEAQVVRLALLYAMLDQSEHIRTEHLKAALALWRYAEDSARFIFGGLSPDQHKILDFLSDGPRTKRDIIHKCFYRNRKVDQINGDIETLLKANKVRVVKDDRGTERVALA